MGHSLENDTMSTTMMFHNIVSVEARPIEVRKDSDGNDYTVRKFVFLDDQGAEVQITLFAQNKTNLSFEV